MDQGIVDPDRLEGRIVPKTVNPSKEPAGIPDWLMLGSALGLTSVNPSDASQTIVAEQSRQPVPANSSIGSKQLTKTASRKAPHEKR